MKYNLLFHRELPSTNDYLAALAGDVEPEEGTVILTDYQSRGRGHGENTWKSDAGMNLLFSVLLRPTGIRPEEQFDLSRVISLALRDLLVKYCTSVTVKWPNDIMVGKRKIAGVLIENSLQGEKILHSIAGIGLNVNQVTFDPAIPSPTSLALETGCHFDIQQLLGALLETLQAWYRKLSDGWLDEIRGAYLENLFLRGTWADYRDGEDMVHGRILDILPGGELLLETGEGDRRKFGFKEIEFLA